MSRFHAGSRLPNRRAVRVGVTATVMTGCLIAAVVTPMLAAAYSRKAASQPAAGTPVPAVRGITPSMAACERIRMICDPQAYQALQLPLSRPDAAGVTLLTEPQVLARLGWTGDKAGASLMTYGQAQASYPSLAAAASTVVDPSREVWVVTRYFTNPVTVPYAGGWGPPSAPQGTVQITAVTTVIDAATGTETDACAGCAVIPAS